MSEAHKPNILDPLQRRAPGSWQEDPLGKIKRSEMRLKPEYGTAKVTAAKAVRKATESYMFVSARTVDKDNSGFVFRVSFDVDCWFRIELISLISPY